MEHRRRHAAILILFTCCLSALAGAQTVRWLNEQTLDSLVHDRKGRPLVVNLWATWCTPCKEEFPDLLRTAKEYPHVDAVAVSVDFPDEIESKILPFMRSVKVSIPVFVSSIEKQDTLINRMADSWNGALPATFVYTSDGARDTFYVGKRSLKGFREAFMRAQKRR